ncbi:metallophosphoesterase [Bacillaceae bacterium S4-13-56]
MTSFLVMSDTHGLTNEIEKIKKRHSFDFLIHCGDSELDFRSKEMEGFLKVRGNCDFDSNYPNEVIEEVDGLKLFVTHGHLFNIKSSPLALSYRGDEVQAKLICFGHTHIAGSEWIDGKVFLNPGSVRLPRGKYPASYSVLYWDNSGRELNVEFRDLEGNLIEGLSEVYKL